MGPTRTIILSIGLGLSLVACKERLPRPIALGPTESPTQSPTATASQTLSLTASPTATPSEPASPTLSTAPVDTVSPTPTPTPTPTPLPTPTAVVGPTPTASGDADIDADGYSRNQGDCNDRDAAMYPGADDVPLDGLDSNCNGVQDHVTVFAGAHLNEGGAIEGARLDKPYGLAQAEDGTFYFSDQEQCLVRAIDPGGVVTTLAGDGTCAYGGDGGPGYEAQLFEPWGVALDEELGVVYIADYENNRVRRVALETGIIDTIAGSGAFGDPEDGVPAQQAAFTYPTVVAVDPITHEVYVAVSTHHWDSDANYSAAVWRLTPDDHGDFISYRIAGSFETPCGKPVPGPARNSPLCDPEGLVVEPGGGAVYISSINKAIEPAEHSLVVKVEDGQLEWLLGDGSFCTIATVEGSYSTSTWPTCLPYDLTLSSTGSLLVPQGPTHLLNVELSAHSVDWFAGNPDWLTQDLGAPPYTQAAPVMEVAFDDPRSIKELGDGTLLVMDTGHQAFFHVTPGGMARHRWGVRADSYLDGPALEATFNGPLAVTTHRDPQTGEEIVYVSDTQNYVVRAIQGGEVSVVAGVPGERGEDAIPAGAWALAAPLNYPKGMAVDGAGRLYLSDASSIYRIADSVVEPITGEGFLDPNTEEGAPALSIRISAQSIALSEDGNTLYLTSGVENAIYAIDLIAPQGPWVTKVAGTGEEGDLVFGAPALESPVLNPRAVAVHEGLLYFSAAGSIARLSEDGLVEAVMVRSDNPMGAGEEVPRSPHSAKNFVITRQGAIYFEAEAGAVRRIIGSGAPQVVGRYDLYGMGGDEGPSTDILLGKERRTLGATFDGGLLIADEWSSNIRRVVW